MDAESRVVEPSSSKLQAPSSNGTLDDILGAFEQALELEKELGTRTVECDRALLMPLRPAPAPKPVVVPPPPSSPSPSPRPSPSLVPSSSLPRSSSSPSPSPRPLNPSTLQPSTLQPSGPLVDFAFIVAQIPQGAAAELLAKMVAAMGYSMTQVTVVAAATAVAAKPSAKVYVVLGGTDAFRTFAPEQRAALGLWTEVAGVPTIVTYSPAKIIAYFRNDAVGLTKAKRQIWSDLKSALARIGKRPPPR